MNERIYIIAPSSLHGLGLFCMDDIKVGYGRYVELMEYVGSSTTTVIGCVWYNIHEVCVDMGCQQIIYNSNKNIKIKEQHCTLMEDQKPLGILQGL